MADKNKLKAARLERRQFRTRKNIFGTTERPRLSVFRSDKHIYAQIIDDLAGKTLAAAASTSGDVRGDLKNAGITQVAFDRGGRMYHGRVKALADAAREGGLKF